MGVGYKLFQSGISFIKSSPCKEHLFFTESTFHLSVKNSSYIPLNNTVNNKLTLSCTFKKDNPSNLFSVHFKF